MPYRSIEELPKSVKVLPVEAQRLFLRVFNDNVGEYGEERAFRIAWGAVKRIWEKDEETGRWVRKRGSVILKKAGEEAYCVKCGAKADLWAALCKECFTEQFPDHPLFSSQQISFAYLAQAKPLERDGKHYAEIYVIDTTVNRAGWQVTDQALERALQSLIDKPLLAYPDHSSHVEVGKFVDVSKPDGYAVGVAEISDEEAWRKIHGREWRYVSPYVTGFWVTNEDGVDVLYDFQFDHVALVPNPAYPSARVLSAQRLEDGSLRTFSAALTAELAEVRSMTTRMAQELAPRDMEWDFDASRYTAEQLRRACAWYAGHDPGLKKSYKLPHHLPDGRVVWRGVAQAMAVLLGARGGVDIPAGDRRGVYDHLARHYRQFGEEPPEYHAQKPEQEGEKRKMSEDVAAELRTQLEETQRQLAEAQTKIAALEASKDELKTWLDRVVNERHAERVEELVGLRLKAGLADKRDEEAERLSKLGDDVLDLLIADTRAFVAHLPRPSGPKAKYTAEEQLDAVEKVRMRMFGYRRDKEGKIVGSGVV